MAHPHKISRRARRNAAAVARAKRDARQSSWDTSLAPFAVLWELTGPRQPSTSEALAVVDQLARFGPSVLALTGDGLLARLDLEEIVAAANASGLRVALAPSTVVGVTRRRLRSLRDAGIRRVALNLDGPVAPTHDAVRGAPGSFARTRRIAAVLREEGIPLQVNTTVTRTSLGSLPAMAAMVTHLDAVQWSIRPSLPTKDVDPDEVLTAAEHETLYHWIYDLSRRVPFDVKVTEAPAYRRVAIQRQREDAEANALAAGWLVIAGDTLLLAPVDPMRSGAPGRRFVDELDRPTVGIGDGRGFMFISSTGDVRPSGDFPLSAGNVREHSPVEIYREAPLFRVLRDPARLKGRCGRCDFGEVCGGSRARACVVTGDPLAQDPSCAGEPRRARN